MTYNRRSQVSHRTGKASRDYVRLDHFQCISSRQKEGFDLFVAFFYCAVHTCTAMMMNNADEQRVYGYPPPIQQPGMGANRTRPRQRQRQQQRRRPKQSQPTPPKYNQPQQTVPSNGTLSPWSELDNPSIPTSLPLPLSLPLYQPQEIPTFGMPTFDAQPFPMGSGALPQYDPNIAQ